MGQGIIGRVIGGRYEVEAFIASGGMKTVYRVRDRERSVPLAMKMLHGDLEEDPAVLRGFQRETQAIKKLQHPNIVRFYGLEQAGDSYFMLEEFIDGPSLKDVLKERKGLPVEEALVYFKALCAALGYAHVNGVVHCDVKPGNVMIDQGGNILLTDFGIARHAGSDSTSTFAGAGTPAYMAPEQVRGEAVTAETDIYALGVVLFEMLTGQRPFRGTEAGLETAGSTQNERVRYAHLKMPPPDPRSLNPNIPQPLADAVLTALAKNPKARYRNTQMFLQAVCQGAGIAEGIVATRVAALTSPGKTERIITESPVAEQNQSAKLVWNKVWHKLWPQKAPFFAAGGVALIILAILVFRSFLPPGTITETATAEPTASLTSTVSQVAEVSSLSKPTKEKGTSTPAPTDTPIPPSPVPPDGDVVYIDPGPFLMGATEKDIAIEVIDVKSLDDELPAHDVYLDSYWIDRTEVTNKQFMEFVNATNYETLPEINRNLARIFMMSKRPEYFINDMSANWRNPDATGQGIDSLMDHPVVQVTWQDADAYCRWAGGHLPTEAQWEKAARGTDGRVYPWGNKWDGNRLNASDKTLGMDKALFIYNDGYKYSAPVGSYPEGASPYGVLDMAGNVLEWVQDFYDRSYYSASPQENPTGPSEGTGGEHSLRGGSWFSGPRNSRIAHRIFPMDAMAYQNYGFRCAYDNGQ